MFRLRAAVLPLKLSRKGRGQSFLCSIQAGRNIQDKKDTATVNAFNPVQGTGPGFDWESNDHPGHYFCFELLLVAFVPQTSPLQESGSVGGAVSKESSRKHGRVPQLCELRIANEPRTRPAVAVVSP